MKVLARLFKALLFVTLPLLVLLGLTEGVLWAIGLGDPHEQLAKNRGFDESAAYFIPDPERAGGWRTQMFGQEMANHELDIPPRDDRVRVLLFGGSNTQGFPETLLERLLNKGRPQRAYEVINLGRSGYGSERVSILFRQALETLAPDVVFIYSGHNEFMEAGFALELTELYALPWMERVSERLSRLRTMNVLTNAFHVDTEEWQQLDQTPESRRNRGKRFDHLQHDDTLVFWREYQRNLEGMIGYARERGVEVVIGTLVGNMLATPWQLNLPDTLTEDEVNEFARLYKQGRQLLPAGIFGPFVRAVRVKQPDWGQHVIASELDARRAAAPPERQVAPPLRTLIGAFGNTPATDAAKTHSVAGAHWPEPALWTEPVHLIVHAAHKLHHRKFTPKQREETEQAVALLEQALAIAPDHPGVHYDLGLAKYGLGDDVAAAVEHLRLAGDYDRAPRRVCRYSNGLVRELASAWAADGVVLADFERLAEESCPDGLIGYEITTDVCHLQPGVQPIFMESVAPLILELGQRAVERRRAP